MTIEPHIVIYEDRAEAAPAAQRFLGCFFIGSQRLPVIFNHETRDALITAMRDFWAAEMAKKAKNEANRAAQSARARKALQ